ncbi:hypothetical protein B0H13DRAFT_1871229 [Mycena leptocephala]|nr:hypothetical protein B0H13DRAFT_1871229 [Mycena leptocephala]
MSATAIDDYVDAINSSEHLNTTTAGTVRRPGRLQGPDDGMGELKVKCRKSRECGGLCTIERRTHLSLWQEYLRFGVALAEEEMGRIEWNIFGATFKCQMKSACGWRRSRGSVGSTGRRDWGAGWLSNERKGERLEEGRPSDSVDPSEAIGTQGQRAASRGGNEAARGRCCSDAGAAGDGEGAQFVGGHGGGRRLWGSMPSRDAGKVIGRGDAGAQGDVI